MRHIKFLPFLIFFLIIIQKNYAQDSVLIKSIYKISQKIDQLESQINEKEFSYKERFDDYTKKQDSTIKLNHSYLESLTHLIKYTSNKELESLQRIANQQNNKYKKQVEFIQWQAIIYAILIVLLALLIVLVLKTRKNTINYLISESNKIDDNQKEIKEKADLLYNLSIEISEEIKQQKTAIKSQSKALKSQEKSIKKQDKTIFGKLVSKKSKKKK